MWVETGTDCGEEPALEEGAGAAAPLEAVVTGEEYEPVPEEGEPVEEDPVVALPYSAAAPAAAPHAEPPGCRVRA